MSARHPGGQWVNGCVNPADPHDIGECAPDDAPTYSDGAVVQARVDAVMGDALTDDEQESLWSAMQEDERLCYGGEILYAEVARIITARTSAAVKQAQADERERIAQAIEYEACGCVTADGEDDTSDEAFGACKRAVEHAARIARGADL